MTFVKTPLPLGLVEGSLKPLIIGLIGVTLGSITKIDHDKLLLVFIEMVKPMVIPITKSIIIHIQNPFLPISPISHRYHMYRLNHHYMKNRGWSPLMEHVKLSAISEETFEVPGFNLANFLSSAALSLALVAQSCPYQSYLFS